MPHAGSQRDLGRLAGGLQPAIQGADDRIAAGRGEGGHVEPVSYTHLTLPTSDLV